MSEARADWAYCFALIADVNMAGYAFDQAVIEANIWRNVRAYMRDVTISEEKIALDVVKEVGHGNTFLTHPHTARNFKKELHFFDERTLAWEATLSDSMVPEAKEIAKSILKEHTVPALDPAVVRAGEELIDAYQKEAKE